MVRARGLVPCLCVQLHRSEHPLDPRPGHQGEPARRRCRARVSLRNGVRDLLFPVRHSTRAPRGPLVSRPFDRVGSCGLVADDRGIGARELIRGARARPGGRRDRRGERDARRLFAARRPLPRPPPGERDRHLLGGPVRRRRAQPAARRLDRACLVERVCIRGGPFRARGLASRVSRRSGYPVLRWPCGSGRCASPGAGAPRRRICPCTGPAPSRNLPASWRRSCRPSRSRAQPAYRAGSSSTSGCSRSSPPVRRCLPAHRRCGAVDRLRRRGLRDRLVVPDTRGARPAGVHADLGDAPRGARAPWIRRHRLHRVFAHLLGAPLHDAHLRDRAPRRRSRARGAERLRRGGRVHRGRLSFGRLEAARSARAGCSSVRREC